MDIRQYLDSTYLKTAEQAGLSEEENLKVAGRFVEEAIAHKFKLVMLRPDHVTAAKRIITEMSSNVLVGTVIDFPLGTGSLEAKLEEAAAAIRNGADELDFVLDYSAYKAGKADEVKKQVLECTRFCLTNGKIVKWIIEVAALNDHQIVQLSALVKNIVLTHFEEEDYNKVFVKSSTGFYTAENGRPNGATLASVTLMLENSFPLPVKAAGGVKTYKEAEQMIMLGVKRIGTSAAKEIAKGEVGTGGY